MQTPHMKNLSTVAGEHLVAAPSIHPLHPIKVS